MGTPGSPEIICRHHCVRSGGLLIRSCFLLAPDVNRNAARSGRRQVRGNRRLFDARYLLQLRHEAANELALLGRIDIPRLIEHQARRQKVVMFESELLMIQKIDRANQQAAPDQQKQGERDLSADQDHAQPIVCSA